MHTSDPAKLDDAAGIRWLDEVSDRRVAVERHVRSVFVAVGNLDPYELDHR